MKVSELTEILEGMDSEAEVLIMSQKSWPFEYSIHSVLQRADFEGDSAIEEDEDKETSGLDVIIVEGEQLRYGNKDAWLQ